MEPSPALDLEAAARDFPGPVVAIGTFDGVHLAHRALVQRARQLAAGRGAPVLALTFEPHPKEVLLPRPPPRLASPAEKVRRLRAAGADGVCALRFDRQLAAVPGADFVDQVLVGTLGVTGCVVGYNFSFGAGGKGRPEDLARLGEARGLEVQVLDAMDVDDLPVSSSSIRVLVSCGDVEEAGRRLGEPHRLTGHVVRGAGRGRGLGFATANLALDHPGLLVPKRGVYMAWALLDGGPQRWPALVNLGFNPTFDAEAPEGTPPTRIEAHLVDFPGEDLYGRHLTLALVSRLRDERRFPGPVELSAQIAADVEALRGRLAEGMPC